jgi:regulator of protease activity HflC (stomatin/prohibitin superfamily)
MRNLLFLLVALFAFTGCTRVDQGYIGLKVHHAGDERSGIREVDQGWTFYFPVSSSVFTFPTHIQRIVWSAEEAEGSRTDEAFRIPARDQLEFTLDVALSYYVNPAGEACASNVYRTFKRSFAEITETSVRDVVRGAMQEVFSRYDTDFIYGRGREIVRTEVEAVVARRLGEIVRSENDQPCFVIADFSITRYEPPARIREAVERRLEADQEAEREHANLRRTRIQLQQDSLRSVRQAADNLVMTRSLTQELIQYQMVQKWDGKLPQVQGTSGTMFNLNPR